MLLLYVCKTLLMHLSIDVTFYAPCIIKVCNTYIFKKVTTIRKLVTFPRECIRMFNFTIKNKIVRGKLYTTV